MNEKDYLKYVRELRKRVANDTKFHGMTKWALAAASVYLWLRALPSLVDLRTGVLPTKYLIVMFAHSMGIFVGLQIIYEELRGKRAMGRFDYRFKREYSRRQLIQVGAIAWCSFGLYGISAYLMGSNMPELSKVEGGFFHISGTLFLFLAVLPLLMLIIGRFKDSNSEAYPTPSTLKLRPTKAYKRISIFFAIVAIVLVSFNAYYFIEPSFPMNENQYETAQMLGMELALIAMVLQLFLSFLAESDKLETLDNLERDIVLHGIPVTEIKLRLQDEHLGHEFSSWLSAQMATLEDDTKELNIVLNKESEFFQRLSKIDRIHKHDRMDLITEYETELNLCCEKIENLREKLNKCFVKLLESVKHDSYLLTLIQQHIAQAKQIPDNSLLNAKLLLNKLANEKRT